jgi:hypothetical protein
MDGRLLLLASCFLYMLSSCQNLGEQRGIKNKNGGKDKDYYFENSTLIRTESATNNRIFLDFYLGMSTADVDNHLKVLRTRNVIHELPSNGHKLYYFFLHTSDGDSIRAYFNFYESDFYNDTLFLASIKTDSYVNIGTSLFYSKPGSSDDEQNHLGDLFTFFIAKHPELNDFSEQLKVPIRVVGGDLELTYSSARKPNIYHKKGEGFKQGISNLDGSTEPVSPYPTGRRAPIREEITYRLMSISEKSSAADKRRETEKSKAKRSEFKKSVEKL